MTWGFVGRAHTALAPPLWFLYSMLLWPHSEEIRKMIRRSGQGTILNHCAFNDARFQSLMARALSLGHLTLSFPFYFLLAELFPMLSSKLLKGRNTSFSYSWLGCCVSKCTLLAITWQRCSVNGFLFTYTFKKHLNSELITLWRIVHKGHKVEYLNWECFRKPRTIVTRPIMHSSWFFTQQTNSVPVLPLVILPVIIWECVLHPSLKHNPSREPKLSNGRSFSYSISTIPTLNICY
jgi:hypothetical protein